GAFTDRTFGFKNRGWLTQRSDAHRDRPTCSGTVTLGHKGEEGLRVTRPRDRLGEAEHFICHTCGLEPRHTSHRRVDHPADVKQESVIGANHYKQFDPPAVIREDANLQLANVEQLHRTERLK